MSTQAWMAVVIFGLSYVMIATERIDRTLVALAGAALMLTTRIVGQESAFHQIDLNVIFLLAGMMIVVSVIKRSGLFEWIAIVTAKLSGGKPFLLLALLSTITALVSAFLDNVTTVLFIAPITLLIATQLKINPVPFIISEALASNIGGTATLIGDPPNILIGSAAHLSFLDFVKNLTPLVLLIFVVFLVSARLIFSRELGKEKPHPEMLGMLVPARAIRDPYLVWKSLIALGVILVFFTLHDLLRLEPATVALGGAVFLLLLTQLPPRKEKMDSLEKILSEIDWHTLFFFIGMFIMISGLESTGVIQELLKIITSTSGGRAIVLSLIILWGSAFLTFITSSVPFVIAMLPVIKGLASHGVQPIEPLWWALALGACLGGNGTLIGAAANMVITGVSTRSGHEIGFWTFTKKGMPITIISLIFSSFYIWVRYFLIEQQP